MVWFLSSIYTSISRAQMTGLWSFSSFVLVVSISVLHVIFSVVSGFVPVEV